MVQPIRASEMIGNIPWPVALFLLTTLGVLWFQIVAYARLVEEDFRADMEHRARMSQFDTTSSE